MKFRLSRANRFFKVFFEHAGMVGALTASHRALFALYHMIADIADILQYNRF
jgi:hypothetical protein